MSRLASGETNKSVKFRRSQDIEKDIQVARENNDKASEVLLKRELKKSLIWEHTETSSPMQSSVTLDYFLNSHCQHSSLTVEERLIQIGEAKKNMNYKPSFIAATKKYYQNCVSDGLLRSNNRKIVHFVRHGEGFHNLLARLIGKKAYM
jgi:hypothetical protein